MKLTLPILPNEPTKLFSNSIPVRKFETREYKPFPIKDSRLSTIENRENKNVLQIDHEQKKKEIWESWKEGYDHLILI